MFDFGLIMRLQQKGEEAKLAFAHLKQAINETNFSTKDYSKIITSLDNILEILRSLKEMQGVPPEAQAMADSGIVDVGQLKAEVQAGKYSSKEQMTQKVDELIAEYKQQLGPFGSVLE